MADPDGLALDLTDFDAVGIAAEIVVALRVHAIESVVDTAATVSAPGGWHRVVITARQSGHVVLSVRFGELTSSRWNNVADALARRGWDLDEDHGGANRRYPPGTEPTTVAFEILAAIPLAGAPTDVRQVTATDANGHPVHLTAG